MLLQRSKPSCSGFGMWEKEKHFSSFSWCLQRLLQSWRVWGGKNSSTWKRSTIPLVEDGCWACNDGTAGGVLLVEPVHLLQEIFPLLSFTLSLFLAFGFYKTQQKLPGESSVKIKAEIHVRRWEKIILHENGVHRSLKKCIKSRGRWSPNKNQMKTAFMSMKNRLTEIDCFYYKYLSHYITF